MAAPKKIGALAAKVGQDVKAANGTKDVNWAKVEVLYRAGIRSLQDIGAEYGISKGRISQVAKKGGWVRDLAPKIREQAQAKVDRDTAREELNRQALNDPAKQAERRLTEQGVTDLASDAQANVIGRHKRGLGRLGALRDKLVGELELMTDNAGVLSEYVESIDETGPSESGRWVVDRKAQMMQAILETPDRVESLKKLAEIDERLRKGEREAFGIDSSKTEKDSVETALDRVKKSLGLA